MTIKISLVSLTRETNYVPLGVLGYCMNRTNFLKTVFEELELPEKTVHHKPEAKLQDILVGILAGCRAISQVNSLIRPDIVLAQAWGRKRFAEQSLLSSTLDTFEEKSIEQLRQGSTRLLKQTGRVWQHDFGASWLWFDIDLTPLPISKQAEASTKGKFEKKNRYGRQLARVHAPQYHETLFSKLYPGKQDSGSAYIPILEMMASVLNFTTEQKEHTILRSDAGFGSDHNVNYALNDHWQLLTKGKGGKRPSAFAAKIDSAAWQPLSPKRWGANSLNPPIYTRPTQHFVIRWVTEQGEIKYGTLVCSILDWSLAEVMAHYDDRGCCEVEIQADKRGLQLERRRKKHLMAQEALILMTDLAHNLSAWATHWMFPTGPYAHFGPLRFTQDILSLPGRLIFEQERLVEIHLNKRHPHAAEVSVALQRLLDHFDLS